MNILIAGGSGLIGQELVKGMADEHQFTFLGRTHKPAKDEAHITWDDLDQLDAHQFDAVIHLSGLNIAASRWTDKVKKEIINSRVKTTEKLVNWILKQGAKPHIYCANAVGIYGLQENGSEDILNEDSYINWESPKDFLSEIGIRWQQALIPAEQAGVPVTTTRFGVVLKKGGGFLGKMQLSFNFGLGSVIGDGTQYLSWVDSEDLVGAYRFLLRRPDITGAVNITSPQPCKQKDFAKAYASSLHRPLFLKTPAFLIKILFGEMGESLINHGQKVVPKRLLKEGFVFKKPTIEESLN